MARPDQSQCIRLMIKLDLNNNEIVLTIVATCVTHFNETHFSFYGRATLSCLFSLLCREKDDSELHESIIIVICFDEKPRKS